MKVLYVLSATYMGGATISFLSLLEGMVKRGVQTVVTITDNNPEFIALLDNLNVKYYIVPVAFHSHARFNNAEDMIKYPYRMLRSMRRWFISIRAIKKIARKEKPDIIHTNVGPIHAGFVAAQKLGIHHVWHVREYGDKDFSIFEFPSTAAFKRDLAKDYTISITKDIRKHNLLEGNKKAYVVYNGVRNFDDVHYDKDKENYFLCASQIGRAKGHDDVIRAFTVFHKNHNDWRLRIIGLGGGEFLEELKQMVRDAKLEEYVSFEGYKSNVTDYMRKAKALIVASHYEGFGRMTAEASFAGCMVIGRDTGGTHEIMEKTGGIKFLNLEQLVEGMEKVATMTEDEYRESVLKSQKIAQENFSIEAYIDNVYNVYKDIIGNKK